MNITIYNHVKKQKNRFVFPNKLCYYVIAFHYGIEFPLKKESLSITTFIRIGHSFNSNYENKICDSY